MIDRYGRELEWDFQSQGIDVRAFWRSGHWSRFDSFVEQFELHPRSWLRWAQDNDVDRHEAAEQAGLLKKGSGRIETFEWSPEASGLNTVITLLDKLIHVTAQKGVPKGKQKKWKPPRLVWPFTATDGLKARMRARHEQATKSFMSRIEFVPEAEYLAEIEEDRAAAEALARADAEDLGVVDG